MSNYTILDLFRQEVETQVTTLIHCLNVLKTQPSSVTELEQAIQAAHSLWGVVQIIDIEDAGNLVQRMKDCFIAAQNQTITLVEDQIDVLLHASDLLISMSKSVEGFQTWISNHSWDWATTYKAIAIILNSESAAVTANLSESNIKTSSVQIAPVAPLSSPLQLVEEINEDVFTLKDENFLPETIQPQALLSKSIPEVEEINDRLSILEVTPNSSTETVKPQVLLSEHPQPQVNQNMTMTATSSDMAAVISTDSMSMMELFRLEVEAQVAILNNGLLALENNPRSAQELEALMRAAHSVKGAARIVSLEVAVNLAHVMEDCFVEAQKKTITLNPDHVDVLLQGVDLLQSIIGISNAELSSWLTASQTDFEVVRKAIASILNPETVVIVPKQIDERSTSVTPVHPSLNTPVLSAEVIPLASSPTASMNTENSYPAVLPVQEHPEQTLSIEQTSDSSTTQDRVVRVSAENLNRIMGLAGESLIEANWLQPFADSMTFLKSRLVELSRTLEQFQDAFERNLDREEEKEYLEAARLQEQECRDFLGNHLDELELYARRTANLSDRLYREVISSHMRPFTDGVQGFPRMIRDLARKLNKQVKLQVVGNSTPVDRDILKKLEAPLTHILRNAVDHGLELPAERIAVGKPPEGTIRLEAFHRGGMLAITITDDGRGINIEQLRQKVINKNLSTPDMAAQLTDAELMEFLFLPGFSTAKQVTEISGRGVGLDIAKSMAQEVGGTVRATSQPGKSTTFHFQLPLTLSVVRTLLVEISGKPYAIPLARIEQIVTLDRSEIANVESRQYFSMNQQEIGLIAAHQVLELSSTSAQAGSIPVVVISDQSNIYGLVVDKFLGERDLVVRPLDRRLGKVPNISATALLGDGSPILIIDVSDMVRSMDSILKTGRLAKVAIKTELEVDEKRKAILVVDDSITVREMERKLLENRGYYVDIAVNGLEGWNAVRTKHYDLVLSDIDMPRMNGIELVKQIKSHPRLHSLPVIIISYRDREEDRLQGLEAGADYYLTKSSFHDETLINAVVDLIGH